VSINTVSINTVAINTVAINTEPSRDGEHRRNREHPITAADLLGGAMTCFCEVATDLGPGGDVVLLRVAGEIDMLSLASCGTRWAWRWPGRPPISWLI
jgi:hypothetical protein